jgi:hypothetical protein
MLISLAAIRHKIRYFEQTEKMLYRIINEIIHMWPNETCLRNASLEQITVQGRQMEPLSEIGGWGYGGGLSKPKFQERWHRKTDRH